MTDPDRTAIALIIDESGSMEARRQDVITGIDAFMSGQRGLPGRCGITRTFFSVESRTDLVDAPVDQVGGIADVYKPDGYTALFEAICRTVDTLGARLAALPERERPGKVIVVIMTDGEENRSAKQFDRARVRATIARQRDVYAWQFVFLGCGEEALREGRDLGLGGAASVSFAGSRAGDVLRATSRATADYRSGASASMCYDDATRADLATDAPAPAAAPKTT